MSRVDRARRAVRATLVAKTRVLVAALALAALAAGCSRAPRPVPPPALSAAPAPSSGVPGTAPVAGKQRPKAGYDALADSLAAIDTSVLRGKRIALDPGHGGYFTGCIGVGGTTEAEVNLGVALRLRDLLTAAGAEVKLTRERDRDYLTPADSTLRSDLAKRVEIANTFHADLFISIHHNADPAGAHDVNETQVYYQLGDDGPSYDAANDVLRSLARNIGIETVKLIPGNFYVVRGSEAPALLTETSYLTDPDVEARLKTDAARLLEAQALYVGVARFFARKAPRITDVMADSDPENGRVIVHAHVHGAHDEIDARIDGERAHVLETGSEAGAIQFTPVHPLTIGMHAIRLFARLASEGASPVMHDSVRVGKSPRSSLKASIASLGAPLGAIPPEQSDVALHIAVLDQDGLPRPGSIAIRVRVLKPLDYAPRETTLVSADGTAWGYFHLRSRIRPRMRAKSAELVLECRLPAVFAAGAAPTLAKVAIGKGTPRRAGFALEMPKDVRLERAPGTAGAEPTNAITRDGFLVLPVTAANAAPHAPHLAGFRAWSADTLWPPRYTAIAGGALVGKRIVLDAEGGGEDAAGIGRTGTRAATLNLDVARALAAMLRAAGAEVKLTREGDAAISEVERVQIAEGFRAERYLRIGHAAVAPVLGHYFSSTAGRRWGQRTAAAARALGLDSVAVHDVFKYPLTQASSTALYASLARIDGAASEARLLTPGALRLEAYALYVGLLRDFAPEAEWPLEAFTVRDVNGQPVAGAPVTLGGALVLQSGSDGVVRFLRTEPGPLEVQIADPRAAQTRLLLDSSPAHGSSETR